jgi:hypothetical protein
MLFRTVRPRILEMQTFPPPPIPLRVDLSDDDAPPPRRRPAWVLAVVLLLVVSLALVAIAPLLAGEPEHGTDFAFLGRAPSGDPVRWNPCDPIHYVVNASLAPTGSLEDVHEAIRRISDATGIAFAYDGLSDEEPSAFRKPFMPDRYGTRWAPVLIGWVDPDASDIPFEDAHGTASAVASPQFPYGMASDLYVSGWIAMNREDPNPPGFGAPGEQGPVLLHELGHVMGLGHVPAFGEIMHAAGGGVTDLGPGDRKGLERLGSSGGCLTVPQAHA